MKGMDVSRQILKVPSKFTLDDMERFHSQLIDTNNRGESLDILLPLGLTHPQFANWGAIFQFIISWKRLNPEGQLRIRSGADLGQSLTKFVTADHGLVAGSMSRMAAHHETERNLSTRIEQLCRKRLDDMDVFLPTSGLGTGGRVTQPFSRGAKTFVVCCDHSDQAFPRTLYEPETSQGEPSILKEGAFQRLIEYALELTKSQHDKLPSREVLTAFNAFVWELFSNTHEWGRKDPHAQSLRPSVRGLRVELHRHAVDVHRRMVIGQPLLEDYITKHLDSRSGGLQRIVEVTIFDSGPGVASRELNLEQPMLWTQTQDVYSSYGLEKEHSAFVKCLQRHSGTSGQVGRGNGLHRVMWILSQLKAFMYVRTGRLALARDFIKEPFPAYRTKPLLDWKSKERTITEHPAVDGALYVILFPLET